MSSAALRPAAITSLSAAALLLASAGCVSYVDAANDMKARHPDVALEYVSRALKDKPDDPVARKLLQDLSDQIATEHQASLRGLAAARKFDDGVAQCDRVVVARDLVVSSGGDLIHDLTERSNLAQEAADQHYQAGVAIGKQVTDTSSSDGKKTAAKAAIQLRLAMAFGGPAYKDAQGWYERLSSSARSRILVPHFRPEGDVARRLSDDVTTRFQAAVTGKKSEFLELCMGDQDVPDLTGRLRGVVKATFADTGWRDTAGDNAIPMRLVNPDGTPVLDDQGNQVVKMHTGHWIIHERRTSLQLDVSYTIEKMQGGSLPGGQTSRTSGDGYRYSEFSGDMDTIPTDVQALPHASRDVKGPQQLYEDVATPIANDLADKLFRDFKNG